MGSTACRRLDVDVDVDDGTSGREKEREDATWNAVQWILDDGRAMAADATRSKGRRSAMVSADYLQYCCLSLSRLIGVGFGAMRWWFEGMVQSMT